MGGIWREFWWGKYPYGGHLEGNAFDRLTSYMLLYNNCAIDPVTQ